MSTIGTQGKTTTGANAALRIYTTGGSAKLYGTAENWSLREQYKVLEEAVANTNTPMEGTGVYHGEFQSEVILTTDNNNANGGFRNQFRLVNGDLVQTSCTLQYFDSNANQSSIITGFACRWGSVEQQETKDDFVRYTMKGTLIGPSSEVTSP